MALNPPKWAKILINLFLLVQKRVRKLMGVAINRYPGFILIIFSFLLRFLIGLLNMRFSTSVFLSVSLCLASLCGIFTSAPAMADEKGWVLTQKSEKFGDQYIYISGTGLKLVSPARGINIVTCAPDWNVALYNDKTRMYYSTTFDKWMADLDRKTAGNGQDMSDRNWAKTGSTQVAGLVATKYTMNGGGPPGGKRATIRHADCWISNDIAVPGRISKMLAKAYGLPDTHMFPLKVSYVNNSGSLSSMLDTYYTKTCPIPANYFGLPQGYRRGESEADVMIDDETKQILNDLASDQPSRSTPTVSPTYQPTYQQRPTAVAPTYVPPVSTGNNPPTATTAATPTASGTATTAAPASIDFGNGYSLDREKLRKIKEALLNPNKTP